MTEAARVGCGVYEVWLTVFVSCRELRCVWVVVVGGWARVSGEAARAVLECVRFVIFGRGGGDNAEGGTSGVCPLKQVEWGLALPWKLVPKIRTPFFNIDFMERKVQVVPAPDPFPSSSFPFGLGPCVNGAVCAVSHLPTPSRAPTPPFLVLQCARSSNGASSLQVPILWFAVHPAAEEPIPPTLEHAPRRRRDGQEEGSDGRSASWLLQLELHHSFRMRGRWVGSRAWEGAAKVRIPEQNSTRTRTNTNQHQQKGKSIGRRWRWDHVPHSPYMLRDVQSTQVDRQCHAIHPMYYQPGQGSGEDLFFTALSPHANIALGRSRSLAPLAVSVSSLPSSCTFSPSSNNIGWLATHLPSPSSVLISSCGDFTEDYATLSNRQHPTPGVAG